MKILKKLLYNGIFAWIIFLAIWQIGSLFVSEDFLPSPIETLKGGYGIVENGILFKYIAISFSRIFKGWGLGIIIAVPIGLLIGQFNVFRQLAEPLINFFRFVPAIGFLTLFLMWFGVGEESKVAIITYATIFPICINTIGGVSSINPITIQVAESQGATPFQIFYSVTLPASVSHIFLGVRLGLSGAIISIAAAEMLAAKEGIGYLIYTSRLYFKTEWIFIGILALGLSGYIFDKLLRLFGKLALRRFGVME